MKRSAKYVSTIIILSLLFAFIPFDTCIAVNNDIVDIQVGTHHSVALKADGSLWTWGMNDYGQLGNGVGSGSYEHMTRRVPEKIMDGVSSFSAGDFNTYALKKDGSVWAWGSIEHTRTANSTLLPKMIIYGGVKKVFTGNISAAVIKDDDSLWIWGENSCGVVGDGTRINRSTPVKVMENVKYVALESSHTSAIKTDGSLWVWGSSIDGQLGISGVTSSLIPIKLDDNVISVYTSPYNTFYIKTDNSLWACGGNGYGQIGDGTTVNKPLPVKVLDDVKLVSSLGVTIAIKTDGSLWAWGTDPQSPNCTMFSGTLKSPKKFYSGVLSADVGFGYILMLKNDGYIWGWGWNREGVLGDGTYTNRRTPVRIVVGCILTAKNSSGTLLANGAYSCKSVTVSMNGLNITKSVRKNGHSISYPSKGIFSTDGYYVVTGKVGTYAKSFTFTIDKTQPAISAKTATGKSIVNNAYTKYNTIISASDKNLLSRTAKKNGIIISWPSNNTFIQDGKYYINARDKAGNTRNFIFTIDKKAPQIVQKDAFATIIPNGGTAKSNVSVSLTDAYLASKTIKRNGTAITWSSTGIFTANGLYTITAVDKSGNTSKSTFRIAK